MRMRTMILTHSWMIESHHRSLLAPCPHIASSDWVTGPCPRRIATTDGNISWETPMLRGRSPRGCLTTTLIGTVVGRAAPLIEHTPLQVMTTGALSDRAAAAPRHSQKTLQQRVHLMWQLSSLQWITLCSATCTIQHLCMQVEFTLPPSHLAWDICCSTVHTPHSLSQCPQTCPTCRVLRP